jgi:hypothetical protein
MADGAALAAISAPGAAAIDQAIFTSIRSPLARGYRIVAASSGLTDEERRAITQRAPSHGNLSDAAAQASACAGFVLPSGRHCLLFSHHDGPEPSGRGGWRVHTHAFVLAPAVFARFAFDPLRFERHLLSQSAAVVAKLPASGLPRLNAPAVNFDLTAADDPLDASDRAAVGHAIAANMNERPSIVLGARSSRAVLNAVVAGLPACRRARVSFAYGLKLSTSRPFHLLFQDEPIAAVEQFARDQGYTVQLASAPVEDSGPALQAWLAFVDRHLTSGDLRSLATVTDPLTGDCPPARLAAIAAEHMIEQAAKQPEEAAQGAEGGTGSACLAHPTL